MEIESEIVESYELSLKLSSEEALALSQFLDLVAPANLYGTGDKVSGLDIAREIYYVLP
jgi:hypothetical protein